MLQALATQRRVLGALMMRELHVRYGRDNLGFLWLMGEPLMFAAGVLVLWRLLKGPYQNDIPIIPFTLLGYLPLLLFRHSVGRALFCIRSNAGVLYHRTITPLDLFFSRMLIEIAGNILAFLFVFFLLYGADLIDWPADPPLLFLGYFYMAWFTIAVGLVVGALCERADIVEKLWTPASYLMIPVSGAYFLALWLPERFRDLYLLMPTVSAYELIRAGYFGARVESFWDQPYIALWSAGLTLIGLYFFRQAREHLVLE